MQLEFSLAQPSWYVSHYTMLYKYSKCTHNFLRIFIFILFLISFLYFESIFNKTIIILTALIGWLQPTRCYIPHWLSAVLYPMHIHGVIVKYKQERHGYFLEQIITFPGWDGSPSQVTHPSILLGCPNGLLVTMSIKTLGRREVQLE